MKKTFILTFIIITVFSLSIFCGCKPTNPLYDHVSELRSNIFQGSNDDYVIRAAYGYREKPYSNDGEKHDHEYKLMFKLIDKETDDVTYTVSLTYQGQEYKSDFSLNPVKHDLVAEISIDNFCLKEFEINISTASTTKTFKLKSILPENTISYTTALDYLYKNQRAMIDALTDENGNFNAEIFERITVKNGKPYWYIGIATGHGNLKALLIDGFTGETLAIREIF